MKKLLAILLFCSCQRDIVPEKENNLKKTSAMDALDGAQLKYDLNCGCIEGRIIRVRANSRKPPDFIIKDGEFFWRTKDGYVKDTSITHIIIHA